MALIDNGRGKSEPPPKKGGAPVLPVACQILARERAAGYLDDQTCQRIWATMESQAQKGLEKYRQALCFNDGRSLGDAWEELADAYCYCVRHAGSGQTKEEKIHNIKEVEEFCDAAEQAIGGLRRFCERSIKGLALEVSSEAVQEVPFLLPDPRGLSVEEAKAINVKTLAHLRWPGSLLPENAISLLIVDSLGGRTPVKASGLRRVKGTWVADYSIGCRRIGGMAQSAEGPLAYSGMSLLCFAEAFGAFVRNGPSEVPLVERLFWDTMRTAQVGGGGIGLVLEALGLIRAVRARNRLVWTPAQREKLLLAAGLLARVSLRHRPDGDLRALGETAQSVIENSRRATDLGARSPAALRAISQELDAYCQGKPSGGIFYNLASDLLSLVRYNIYMEDVGSLLQGYVGASYAKALAWAFEGDECPLHHRPLLAKALGEALVHAEGVESFCFRVGRYRVRLQKTAEILSEKDVSPSERLWRFTASFDEGHGSLERVIAERCGSAPVTVASMLDLIYAVVKDHVVRRAWAAEVTDALSAPTNGRALRPPAVFSTAEAERIKRLVAIFPEVEDGESLLYRSYDRLRVNALAEVLFAAETKGYRRVLGMLSVHHNGECLQAPVAVIAEDMAQVEQKVTSLLRSRRSDGEASVSLAQPESRCYLAEGTLLLV